MATWNPRANEIFLGALEIDRYGNINTTLLKEDSGKVRYFNGSAGGNDIASLAKRVLGSGPPGPADFKTELWRVSAAGGAPSRLTDSRSEPTGAMMHRWPQVLPGAQAVLFTVQARGNTNFSEASVEVLQLQTGETKTLVRRGHNGRWVASGQISVERELFAAEGEVYASALSTPAAEEYELSLRLRRRGVPILCATRIVALHDQPVEVRAYCRQQYKHGVGCAEAAAKVPDTLCLQELATIIEANLALGGLAWLSPRALAKSVLSSSLGRQTLLAGARALEEVVPIAGLRRRAYYAAVSAHFVGGVRDGLVRFGARSHRAGHE
jgi:hypothetical protein